MKYTLTLSLFLGLLTKEAAAMRLQQHHHHHGHHGHHNNHRLAQYSGDSQAWIDDCAPGRNPFIPGNGNAGTGGSYPGVGIECQGFAQRGSRAQYSGDSQAWIDDCAPGRNPFIPGTGNAGTGGSYPGVGIECQGFAQRGSRAQYSGDSQAWIDDCAPGRNPFIPGTGNAGTGGSYPGVGIECQGFAQKASKARYDGDKQDWVDQCDPSQDTVAQKNPSGAGTYKKDTNGSFPGVGVECQGFAQREKQFVQYDGDKQDWVDKCDPAQDTVAQKNPSGAGTYNGPKTKGSFPGVGVECQGFVQLKGDAPDVTLPGGGNSAWVDQCDPTQDTVAQKNPSGAGTYSEGTKGTFPGVGVDCQGFAQKKSQKLVQYNGDQQDWVPDCAPGRNPYIPGNGNAGTAGSYPGVGITCQGFAQVKGDDASLPTGGNSAWVDKCDPTQDTVAQKNPGGAGTHEDANKGSFKGVGVDCQGFAEVKSKQGRKHLLHDCPAGLPECNGTNGQPGVDCC